VTLRISAAVILIASLLFVACGDDESNPQGGGTNPTASTLSGTVSQNTATMTWTQCPDTDFASYNLYRSTTSGIAANPSSATLVATITTVSTLTFSNTGLAWNTPYYFALQTVDSSQLTAWSNEVPITTPDSSGGGGGSVLSCYQIQGQADESPYTGDDVSVTGIVTVGGGEYYAGSGTAQYAVIQDAGGDEWSGLVLYGYDGVLTPLSRGDSVVVSGYVSEYFGLTEVVVQSVDHDQSGYTVPSPVNLSTQEMSSQEKWEGVLVALNDVTVTSDPTQYGEFYVTDGSGDAMVDDMGIYGFSTSTGDTFSQMIGVCFYGYSEYRLEPRDENDITQ